MSGVGAVPVVSGVDHFSLPCADPVKSLDFYRAVFGATVFEDVGGRYWFGDSEEDRALGRSVHIFMQIGATRVELLGEDPGGVQPFGTHHAFGIAADQLVPVMEHLEGLGVPFWGPATHKGTRTASVYVKDPDNNQLEFVCFDYPDALRAELPLSQQMNKPNPFFDWDVETGRAVPKDAPQAASKAGA